MKKILLNTIIISSASLNITAKAIAQPCKVVGFKVSTTATNHYIHLGKTEAVTLHVKCKLNKKKLVVTTCKNIENSLTINWSFDGANAKAFNKKNYPKIGPTTSKSRPMLANIIGNYIQPGFYKIDKKNNACLYHVKIQNYKKQNPLLAGPIILRFWAQMQHNIVENQSNVIKIQLQKPKEKKSINPRHLKHQN